MPTVLGILACALSLRGQAHASEPRMHDGTYLRLSLGASAIHAARQTDVQGVRPSLGYPVDDSTVAGTAFTAEIAGGYTPIRGVAVTGLVLAHVLQPAELTLVDESSIRLAGPYTLLLVAPGVDVFANPERGLHLSTSVGVLAAHAAIDDPSIDSIGGLGAAGTMALGYDGWVGEEWSLGVFARGLFGMLSGERSSRGLTATERALVTSFGLGVTVLQH